jgi:CRISPR-associated endonuclease/helicase Cas3
MEPLWAKTGRQRKSLLDHTQDVVLALARLYGSATEPTRLGRCWQRFFGLDNYPAFVNCGIAAAAFHDWGKANDGFQAAMISAAKQLIYHEHLGALMLNRPEVQAWLRPQSDVDWDIVLSVVLTHHLRANHDTLAAWLWTDRDLVLLLTAHPQFLQLLVWVGERLRLPTPLPTMPDVWSFASHRCLIATERRKLQDRLHRFRRLLDRPDNAGRARLLTAVRSAVIAADAVGSALPRVQKSIVGWLEGVLDDKRVLYTADIWTKVIEPRLDHLRAKNRWNDSNGRGGWNEFQVVCATKPKRTLLLAPCGAGKTLAAWRWIAEQCRDGVLRVIFLYPTRATATEGFRDYVSWAPEDEATLMHGTAEYELQDIFGNPGEGADPRREKDFAVDSRLFALGAWSKRIFAATVDQFFAFLQHGYAATCLLPLLADSVIVVDEVHSFDRSLFSSLKQFLQNVDVPVLCMTASLLPSQRQELEDECGLTVYDEKPGELATTAGAPRYRVRVTVYDDAVANVRAALQHGNRVLWVVNQVRRAQQAARAFALDCSAARLEVERDVPLICYHSRFKLTDRKQWHQQVVDTFQNARGAALAITTQVCEMSLDLDADLLVTEFAPIPSLIQRFGRCNRKQQPRTGAGDILVYRPEDEKPYDADALTGANDFLQRLSAKDSVNQVDLEEGLKRFGPDLFEPPKDCRFLSSGPYATQREETLRDIEAFTVPAVLDGKDLEEFLRLQRDKQPTDGLIVPVPLRFRRQRDDRLPPYLSVAPASHYQPALGFLDEPMTSIPGDV